MIFWTLILLGAIGGIVVGIRAKEEWWSDYILSPIYGTIIGFVIAIIVCWIVGEIFPGKPVYDAPDRPARILNLEDNKETKKDANGAFILVAGGFSFHEDTEQTYSFYQETPDGSYFLHTISTDRDTKIRIHFINDGEVPHAIRRQPNAHWTTPDWIAPMDLISDSNKGGETSEVWTLYVPKGTIRTVDKFELDNR